MSADGFCWRKGLLEDDYVENLDLFDQIVGKTSLLPSITFYFFKEAQWKQYSPKLLQVEYLRQFF